MQTLDSETHRKIFEKIESNIQYSLSRHVNCSITYLDQFIKYDKNVLDQIVAELTIRGYKCNSFNSNTTTPEDSRKYGIFFDIEDISPQMEEPIPIQE